MAKFVDALRSGRVLLMDGAMGTELQRAGLKPGECGEEWNVSHPEQVRAIYRAYVEAGAEVLLTNTFQATQSGLASRGCRIDPQRIVSAAIELARESGRWVVGDLGPFDDKPGWKDGVLDCGCGDLAAASRECDAILLETLSDCHPLVKFLQQLGSRKSEEPSILVSATYLRDEDGIRTITGLTPEAWVQQAEKYFFVVAVGMNCGREIGMKECVEIAHRYRDSTHLPVFVRPNAGTPKFRNERWIYPHSPEYMASWLPELLRAGVSMIGGCCGTTPQHIAAFKSVIDDWNSRHASR